MVRRLAAEFNMSTRGRILQDSGDWIGAEKGDVRVSYEKL